MPVRPKYKVPLAAETTQQQSKMADKSWDILPETRPKAEVRGQWAISIASCPWRNNEALFAPKAIVHPERLHDY